MSEASFSPLLPPLPASSLLPPPHAATVETTAAAATKDTRRREDLDTVLLWCGPGVCARESGGGGTGRIDRSSSPPARGVGRRPLPCPVGEPAETDGSDEAGRGEDHRHDQDHAVDEGGELGGLGVVQPELAAE